MPAKLNLCVSHTSSCLAGSVIITNGGNLGIAGGTPGNTGGTNTAPYLDQQCEIYNSSFPVGSRMTGLLANSTRNRSVEIPLSHF